MDNGLSTFSCVCSEVTVVSAAMHAVVSFSAFGIHLMYQIPIMIPCVYYHLLTDLSQKFNLPHNRKLDWNLPVYSECLHEAVFYDFDVSVNISGSSVGKGMVYFSCVQVSWLDLFIYIHLHAVKQTCCGQPPELTVFPGPRPSPVGIYTPNVA